MTQRLKIMLGCIMLVGIGLIIFAWNKPLSFISINRYQQIYENNKLIVAQGDTYSFVNKQGKSEDNKTDLSFTFEGTDTIWNIKADVDSQMSIDYDANIKSGDFKVVLIDPEDELEIILEGTSKGTKRFNLPKGESRIKMVGRDSEGHLTMTVSSEDKVVFSPHNR